MIYLSIVYLLLEIILNLHNDILLFFDYIIEFVK